MSTFTNEWKQCSGNTWHQQEQSVSDGQQTNSIYHVNEVRKGKTEGMNLLVQTEPRWGPDVRFIRELWDFLNYPHLIKVIHYLFVDILPISHCNQMIFVIRNIWPFTMKVKAVWVNQVMSSQPGVKLSARPLALATISLVWAHEIIKAFAHLATVNLLSCKHFISSFNLLIP